MAKRIELVEELVSGLDKLAEKYMTFKDLTDDEKDLRRELNDFIDWIENRFNICEHCMQERTEALFDDAVEVSCGCGTVSKSYKAV